MRGCLAIYSPSALFFLFLKWRLACALFMPGSAHSGSANWDNCGQMFPLKLCVSSFPERFPHHAWTVAQSAHSDFVGSRAFACLGVTYHFWQNDQDLSHATVVTQGWNRHRIRVSTQINSGEENSPTASAEIRTRNLLIMSPTLLPTNYPGWHSRTQHSKVHIDTYTRRHYGTHWHMYTAIYGHYGTHWHMCKATCMHRSTCVLQQ